MRKCIWISLIKSKLILIKSHKKIKSFYKFQPDRQKTWRPISDSVLLFIQKQIEAFKEAIVVSPTWALQKQVTIAWAQRVGTSKRRNEHYLHEDCELRQVIAGAAHLYKRKKTKMTKRSTAYHWTKKKPSHVKKREAFFDWTAATCATSIFDTYYIRSKE